MISMLFDSNKDAAFLEYVGMDGYSLPCSEAVKRLLLSGHRFEDAIIVTHARHEHAFLLYEMGDPRFVVLSGFSSDSGEGSSTFRRVAGLLIAFGARLDEADADDRTWSRLGEGKLTNEDVHRLRRGDSSNTGLRFLGISQPSISSAAVLDEFTPSVPWGILDSRIADLALSLFRDSESVLRDGFARLEDSIRKKSGPADTGRDFLNRAFRGPGSTLTWPGVSQSEADGRAQLFLGAFQAYRNPLAHGASAADSGEREALSAFMLLNHLFRLEEAAKARREV